MPELSEIGGRVNGNEKAAELATGQKEGQEAPKGLQLSPAWLTFWEMIFDMKAELDERKAMEEAAREAGASIGGLLDE